MRARAGRGWRSLDLAIARLKVAQPPLAQAVSAWNEALAQLPKKVEQPSANGTGPTLGRYRTNVRPSRDPDCLSGKRRQRQRSALRPRSSRYSARVIAST